MTQFLCQNQSSRQPRLGPDAGESHPGRTAGERRMFQGEGAPSRTPLVPPYHSYPLSSDSRALLPEQSDHAPPRSPPFATPRASTRQALRPPPAFEAPPQPSTSGWVPILSPTFLQVVPRHGECRSRGRVVPAVLQSSLVWAYEERL